MAIATHKPTAVDANIVAKLPKVEPDNHKGIVYDDKELAIRSLIANIAGSSWTADYYSQVVGESNDLREIDPGQPDILQQYTEIKDLELKVDSALSSNYNTDTGITTVVGSSLLYAFITPNISDYFVSDAGDNRSGLFRIINVERRTLNRDSVYLIDYEMVGYIEVLESLYSELIGKVIRTYHFSKDRLVNGLSPILKTNDYELITNLNSQYHRIVKNYFNLFFDRRFMTLVVPGQESAVYDSNLVNYLLKIVDSRDAVEIQEIRQIPTDADPYLTQLQFWDLMLERDESMYGGMNKTVGLVSKFCFSNNSYLHDFMYSALEHLVYPTDADQTRLIKEYPEPKTTSDIAVLTEVLSRNLSDPSTVIAVFTDPLGVIPYTKLVTVDDHYVLSADFYNQSANLSLLEQMTKDYIKKQSLDLNKLSALLADYNNWGRLEQFYYGPILITLLKAANYNI